MLLLTLLVGFISCGGNSKSENSKSENSGPSMCECKENFWDPNDKKYGEALTLEDTGNLGGKNLTARKNMVNHFNNMVSYKNLSESDKIFRQKCLKKYKSRTEVMMSNCN